MANNFSSDDFSPEKYVADLSSQSVGGSDLNFQKIKLQALMDETNVALKKNVYQHYEQFIDTAKDISYLASEMYSVSQMLREQRSLIQSILDTSIVSQRKLELDNALSSSASTPTSTSESMRMSRQSSTVGGKDMKSKLVEDEARKKILAILEKVEGASEVVKEEDRVLLHEGDLLEIDQHNYSAIQRKRGYLFNDGIMVASWVTNRRGPQRYKFEAFYDLNSIGLVVNIKDPECPKYTFKLLIFPSVHLLQCPNQQEKDSWVTQIEAQQRILKNPPKFGGQGKSMSINENYPNEKNPFQSLDSFSERAKSPDESLINQEIPEWLVDIPEDLDVWIAQRNFVEAVDLYDTFKEYIEAEHMTAPLKDIKTKVEARIKSLIDCLVADLEIMTPEKILQGGPRSIRKNIDLLIRLGRENQAAQYFLDHRSAFIKHRLKKLKQEGRSHLYIDKMINIFFTNITETIKDYKKLFRPTVSGTSCLVSWLNNEVENFSHSYCQLLVLQSLSYVSESSAKIRELSKLSEQEMDISCIIESTLIPHIERIVKEKSMQQKPATMKPTPTPRSTPRQGLGEEFV